MLSRPASASPLSLSIAAILPALAVDNPSFKVKPGLWQITTDTERSGARHHPGRSAGSIKGFEGISDMGGGQCVRRVTEQTLALRAGTFTCTGREPSSGSFRFEATSAEAVVGDWNARIGEGSQSMNMKAALQGKWLGADCRDVKPREQRD